MPTKLTIPSGIRIKYAEGGRNGQARVGRRIKRFLEAYFGTSSLPVELDPNNGYGSW